MTNNKKLPDRLVKYFITGWSIIVINSYRRISRYIFSCCA